MSSGSNAQALSNVVLITLDTTRADHLGCYGYSRNTTPHIDRFSRDAILFSNAFSVIPLTTPSHASILTGLHPATHQVYRNSIPIPGEFTMLAEIVKKQGYKTAGFVSVKILESRLGFSQGFDHFSDVPESKRGADFTRDDTLAEQLGSMFLLQRRGDRTVEEALSWLEQGMGDPFFLWLHLYDPHLAYIPPKDYGLQFNSDYDAYLDSISGPFVRLLAYADQRGYGMREGGWDDTPDTVKGFRAFFNLLGFMTSRLRTSESVSPDLVDDFIAAYDGEIAFVDEQVGRVFQFLKEYGVYEETLTIVMGDHGEILHEKEDYFGHHKYLYRGSMHIPLIIKVPGMQPRIIDERITTVDVLPTLLNALGIEVKNEMDGVSYWPLLASDSEVERPKTLFYGTHSGQNRQRGGKKRSDTEVHFVRIRTFIIRFIAHIKNLFIKVFHIKSRWRITDHFDKMAVIDNEWKLIRNDHSGKRRDITYELYNMKEDPGEVNNLIDTEVEVSAEMKRLMVDFINTKRFWITPKTKDQTEEEIRTLRSLGYM
jgi:arylsulfatase